MRISNLAAASIAAAMASPSGAAIHGLYPLSAPRSDVLHFIDVDSTRRGPRYAYAKVAVLRRQDVDTVPPTTDANRLRIRLRSVPPVRVESWGADCATGEVQVQEFAGNQPTGMLSAWLVPEFRSIGYEVFATLCPARPFRTRTLEAANLAIHKKDSHAEDHSERQQVRHPNL